MRGPWHPKRAVGIAVGGAAGAACRWIVVSTVTSGQFPWPVLVINVVGSLFLGVLLAEEWSHPSARVLLHDAGAIGFCGGLTTFSTFSLEVVDLIRNGESWIAAIYAVVSVASAIAGVIAGAGALRRIRAVTLPLEEAP